MVYHSSVDSVDCGDCSGSADGVLWGLVMAVVVVLLVTEVGVWPWWRWTCQCGW